MNNILIVVDSWQGHTARVGEEVRSGIASEGLDAVVRTADEATLADVRQAAALIMGSAVHQRGMTWKMKRFVDEVCEPAWFYDDVVGRVGAVFTAGGGHGQAGGGAEQAQIDMLANLAACGMILVPLPKCTPGFEHAGVHWGPTIKTMDNQMNPITPENLDAEALLGFFHHGANVARVTRSLQGLDLARGNRWPSPELSAGRRAAEAHRPSDVRMASSADPTGEVAG
jgi:NAD(P)H dehydrogenase (quinone)